MRPGRRGSDNDTSQDSFLDVIANVVGILIILVMLVGVQASQRMLVAEKSPVEPMPQVQQAVIPKTDLTVQLAALHEEVSLAKRKAIASQSAIKESVTRIVRINHEARQQDQHRDQLAMHRAIIESDLENRRKNLGSKRQQEFDVQRQLVDSQIKLDELTKEQMALLAAPSESEEIECVPTPLAKTIEEDAIHLRLKKGLVSIIPFYELKAQLDHQGAVIMRRMQSRDKVVETFGPINGYRLRFTAFKRYAGGAITGPLVGRQQRADIDYSFHFLPTSESLGQNVEQALMPGSALYKMLETNQRLSPPIVVWLYTDSFEEFRPLKRKLWEMGFSMATRPMQLGTHIGASPHGTKSAAQ